MERAPSGFDLQAPKLALIGILIVGLGLDFLSLGIQALFWGMDPLVEVQLRNDTADRVRFESCRLAGNTASVRYIMHEECVAVPGADVRLYVSHDTATHLVGTVFGEPKYLVPIRSGSGRKHGKVSTFTATSPVRVSRLQWWRLPSEVVLFGGALIVAVRTLMRTKSRTGPG